MSVAARPFRRATACWKRLSSPASARNCFGKPERESGQSRVPLPPAMMTGWIGIDDDMRGTSCGDGSNDARAPCGANPSLADIPYLAGVAAVSAIAAVLSLITPSGLGVREASMYGLLLAITTKGVALGVTVLNRLTITLVEGLLLLAGALAWRFLPRPEPEPETDP